MPRLINAETLVEYKASGVSDLTEWQKGWNDAIDTIMSETPTVDAVEVVRCKDCKWWKTKYMRNGERKVCVIEAYEPVRNEDEYCSWAERREDAN